MPRLEPFTPRPPGCSRPYVEERIGFAFADGRRQQIIELLRQSIRIWPIARSQNPTASRFGGSPAAPAGWSWPFVDGKPLVFLAQINCAEVFAEVGESALPRFGLLAFFGGAPDIHGCGPTLGGAAQYFSDTDHMKLAAFPASEGFETLISCGLSFYKNIELPDHRSRSVAALGLAPSEVDGYRKLREAIATAGFPPRWDRCWISKLFGWPDLVQHEFDSNPWRSKGVSELLLQIGCYTDGLDSERWDPGGTLYFYLREADLSAGRCDAAELEVESS